MTFGRAVCLQDTLEFQRSDNILALRICELIVALNVDGVVTGCCNDCTVLLFYDGFLLFVVDCASGANCRAQSALALCELDAASRIQNGNVRDCLCKRNVCSMTVAQTQVVGIRYILNRTLFGTCTASGTLILVNITSLPANLNAEVADKTGNCFDFTIRINGDILILCAFYHFRCQNTRRAVQCRECLIDLCHLTADSRFFLNDINRIASICNVQCCLDTCNTAADDQCPLGNRTFAGNQRGIQQNLCNSSTSQNNCLGSCFRNILMNPRALLTDVCNFQHVGIQTSCRNRLTERCFVHTRGTRTYDNAVQLMFLDRILNYVLACL